MQDNEKTFLSIVAVLMIFVCAAVAAKLFSENNQANIKPPNPAVEEVLPDAEEEEAEEI